MSQVVLDAIRINWMHPSVKSTNIDRPVKFYILYGLTVWNSLSSTLHDSSLSLNTFERPLKTYILKTYIFGQ